MKNKVILIVIFSITVSIASPVQYTAAQSRDEMVNRAEILEESTVEEVSGRSRVADTIVQDVPRTDTTTIQLGNREIRIIDVNGKTDISILEKNSRENSGIFRHRRPFRGNWQGIDFGLNNYLNSDFSTSLAPEEDFMELRAARSFNLGLNLLQYSLAISGNNIGLVTGMGVEYNNYRFANDVSIEKQNREIVPVWYDEPGMNVERSRFRAIYLNVPLLMEFQTRHSSRSRRGHISFGVVGAVNIGSNTRVVYKDNSSRSRERVRDDFYLSPFRYGFTLRAGYRSLNLYADYYPVTLFQANKGPELYPFSVGISLINF